MVPPDGATDCLPHQRLAAVFTAADGTDGVLMASLMAC